MKEPRLIAVLTTGAAQEAGAARGVLESRGIRVFVDPPGHVDAAPPAGTFRVLVLAEDQRAAEQALASSASDAFEYGQAEADGDQSSSTAARAPRPTPDDYAERAYRAALLYLIVPPILLLVPYYFLRALWASKRQPVLDEARFARRMAMAAIVGIVIPWFFIIWLFSTCTFHLGRAPAHDDAFAIPVGTP